MIVDLFYIFLSLQPQLVYQVILRPFIFSRLLKPSLIQLVVYARFLDASELNCLEDQEVGS